MFLRQKHDRFESMVRAYSRDLYRFGYWLCRDRVVAEDLVQETFARAWRNWEAVRDEKAAKAWLFTILHREHARLFEKKHIEIDDTELDEAMAVIASTVQPSLEMRDALGALPEGYREPLLMQVLGGFTCREIAQALALTEAGVMQRLTRARQAMRRLLEPEANAKERQR